MGVGRRGVFAHSPCCKYDIIRGSPYEYTHAVECHYHERVGELGKVVVKRVK